MINVIIALKATKGRDKLSLALATGGNYNVLAIVTSGADVIKLVRRNNSYGVVICSEKLSDMHYTKLANLLPDNYKILLIKQSGSGFHEDNGNMAMLMIPFNKSELFATIDLLAIALEESKSYKRIKGALVEQAKIILIEVNNMTEPQAHRFMQKRSMDTRTDIDTIAQEIIRLYHK